MRTAIPTITAFAASPDRERGLARDVPVRWALCSTVPIATSRPRLFVALQALAHVRALWLAESSRFKIAKPMRNLFLSTLVFALAANAMACNCFSPEIRARTGRETLELAQAAVFGRIVEVKADGSAELIVLESFKGPQQGATVVIAPGADRCRSNVGKPGEMVLVIVFQEPATRCETYDQEHFLLEAFRANLKK